MAQWLRIRLPMQGTRVQPLVWEDPTCRGAESVLRNKRSHRNEKPPQREATATRSHRNEKPAHHNEE